MDSRNIGVRSTIRAVRRLFPDSDLIQGDSADTDIYAGNYSDPPIVQQVRVLEDRVLRAHPVSGDPVVAFGGFLDGVQQVKIVSHQRGVPIMVATVSAVIRQRIDRRLVTWREHGPLVHRAVYVPGTLVQMVENVTLDGVTVVDTSMDNGHAVPVNRHPAALRATALERIRAARERLECSLGEAWCRVEDTPLFVDGSLRSSFAIATSQRAIGVIKSHQTLYTDNNVLDVVMSLQQGERSSVFRVESKPLSSAPRPVVASWYLRLRDPRGHDAMFGLVRVEVADRGEGYAERANEVSRWILAEASPLALPDSRWDKMSYGIRDAEFYLRAIGT